jgi:hypothetical protein
VVKSESNFSSCFNTSKSGEGGGKYIETVNLGAKHFSSFAIEQYRPEVGLIQFTEPTASMTYSWR